MTEKVYIQVTNLPKLRMAEAIIYDIMEGEEFDVSPVDYRLVRTTLRRMIERLEKNKFIK